MLKLYEMTNSFINRLRWKAFFFNKDKETNACTEYEDFDREFDQFPSRRYGPWCDELSAFEYDLFDLVKNIKFKRSVLGFQKTLKDDVKKIKDSPNVIVFSDKTSNLYEVKPAAYKKLLVENITKEYKKCDHNVFVEIDLEARMIVSKNASRKRIPKFQRSEAFLTIKDHKEKFPSEIPCRLINPSKTRMGKVSKKILDNINVSVRRATGLTQWKNSQEVLSWFDSIEEK